MGSFNTPISDSAGVKAAVHRWNQRRIEPFPARANQPMKHYYIFNMGPFAWTRALGDMGTFVIRPLPDGKEIPEFSACIDQFIFRHYEAGNQSLNYREYDGLQLAQDIIGTLPPMTPDNDLTKYGVFIQDHPNVTAHECEEARERLLKTCQELCLEAEGLFTGDDAARSFVRNSAKHKIAAKVIGYEAAWVTLPAQRVPCPACGGMMIKGAVIHDSPTCGAIIDETRARKFFPDRFPVEEKKAKAS